MTIAIGILASDGVVVAADRSESDGTQKREQRKISYMMHGDPKWLMALTGAGPSAELDSFEAKAWRHFSASNAASHLEVEKELETLNDNFYKKKVLPFSQYPTYERPDYRLIAAFCTSLGGHLWHTNKTSCVASRTYTAVGIGQMTAENILNCLYVADLPVSEVINLAAFVIWEVKATVESCGSGTDIVGIRRDGNVVLCGPDEISEMERAFKLYLTAVHRNDFHRCLGHQETQLTKILATEAADCRAEIQRLFKRLSAAR